MEAHGLQTLIGIWIVVGILACAALGKYLGSE